MPNKTLKKWSCSRLKEITSLKQSKDEVKSLLDTQLVSFVPMECLGINKKYFNSNFEKPIKDLINKYVYFAENDVIMAKITPCFENGKIGIAKNLKNKIGFGSSEYLVFRPNKNVLNEYLYYYLNRNSFREIGAQNMQGAVGHKRLSKEFIEETLIYYPAEIEEQQRIVRILDEAFENIEKTKQNALQNLNNAKELFESYLDKAFTENTDNWNKYKVKDVCKYAKEQGHYNLPYVGMEHIKGSTAEFIGSLDNTEVKSTTFHFDKGIILYGRLRPYLRKVILTTFEGHCSTELFPIKVNDKVNNKFLMYWLLSQRITDKINATWTGARMPRANMNKVLEFDISIPSIMEQQKIVVQLDELQEQTKKLEQIYEQKIKDLDELKQSILQKAFNGEL